MGDEVQNALSLVDGAGLPYPSGPLLESFITEALNPVLAARYVKGRLASGEGSSLVSDWSYIIESSKFTAPASFLSLPFPLPMCLIILFSHAKGFCPATARCCRAGGHRETGWEQVLHHRQASWLP